MRNRVASQNTRDKRKQYVTDLELQVKRLQAEVTLAIYITYSVLCQHITLLTLKSNAIYQSFRFTE